jgi:acyl transferase domain-containing protein
MEPFEKLARSIAFQKPTIPVISPSTSGVVTLDDEVFGPEYLATHARETVNFEAALLAAQRAKLVDANTIWVELGPAPVCSSFVKSSLGAEVTTVPSLRKKEDAWRTITSSLSVLHRKGVTIDWNELYHGYGTTHRVLTLPRYSFDNQNYWIDYLNNWQLTKGELLEAPSKAAKKVRPNGIPSTTVQKITKEDFGNVITVTAESDLSNPSLNESVFGHLVNGSGLVPSVCVCLQCMISANRIAGYGHDSGRPCPQKG